MNKLLILRQSHIAAGGIEGQICRLAQALYEKKLFEPQLATSDKYSQFAKTFAALGFKVHIVNMGPGNILKAATILTQIIKQENICAVQTHLFRESIVARLVRLQNHNIKHIFRPQTYIDNAAIAPWKKHVYHILDHASSRWVDKYVANGQYLAEELILRSRIPVNKISVVINGRDSIAPPDPRYSKPELPFEPRVAMISNLFWKKGHDTLIRALGLLKRSGIIINARLIGSAAAPMVAYLQTLAETEDVTTQIAFYGRTDEIAVATQDYPVLILPSDSEGVPNCILEAMSMRKLVLASAVGGIPELIENGKSGLLFPPRTPLALAEILKIVFTSPSRQWEPLRDEAFTRWSKNFTMDKMLHGYIEVYKELELI
ncbi:MAG: glycosyltransferase [Elusimicrobiaceae bacterium]